MKKFRPLLSACTLAALLPSAAADVWPELSQEMRPWAYNWWMGSAVDEEGLEFQCREMAAKGFGGMHVIPIYGANGPDNRYRKRWRELLSPEWIEAWNLAARIARRHGLGIDLTMGAGWCFGGPWIDKAHAASSGMKVKRASPGGAGYMLDPFDPEAMKIHVAQFEPWFGKNGKAERPRAFYHDSYEYFGAKPKRGQDVDESQLACFRVWTDWCRGNGYLTRNEAHGAPSNILDFYALADIPETEMFGRRDRDVLIAKFASSAAHAKGAKLVAAESCTWIDEHFHERPREIKRFLDLLFLAGVNHVFYHGLCYSPTDAQWPGWVFYASLQMNPRNPIWRETRALNDYVARCQSLFQTWTPANDLAIVWDPASFRAKHPGKLISLSMHPGEWFYGEKIGQVAKPLYAQGYHFDYISRRQLRDGCGARYAEVLDPELRTQPEKVKPGLFPAETGLASTRWRKDGREAYFIVNLQPDGSRRIVAERKFTAMDPLSGRICETSEAVLPAGHSLFIASADAGGFGEVSVAAADVRAKSVPLATDNWKLSAVCGGPELPADRTLSRLADWREFDEHFSGTIRYSTEFRLDSVPKGKVSIDLGDVREIARVAVNGTGLGVRFMPPYSFGLPPDLLRPGANSLTVEVTNLGANRLRWNDLNGVNWKYFTDINIVGIDFNDGGRYIEMDAAKWTPLPSGLLGPVVLTAEK